MVSALHPLPPVPDMPFPSVIYSEHLNYIHNVAMNVQDAYDSVPDMTSWVDACDQLLPGLKVLAYEWDDATIARECAECCVANFAAIYKWGTQFALRWNWGTDDDASAELKRLAELLNCFDSIGRWHGVRSGSDRDWLFEELKRNSAGKKPINPGGHPIYAWDAAHNIIYNDDFAFKTRQGRPE